MSELLRDAFEKTSKNFERLVTPLSTDSPDPQNP
jgi:hypothetical protein